jgi:hypothetical protein
VADHNQAVLIGRRQPGGRRQLRQVRTRSEHDIGNPADLIDAQPCVMGTPITGGGSVAANPSARTRSA